MQSSLDNVDPTHKGLSTARGTATFLPEPKPREFWCPIISVDDHVLEPPDLFVNRVPRAHRDAVPQFEEDAEGLPCWIIDGQRVPIGFPNGASGRPVRELTLAPQRYDEFRRGVFDVNARVADMDINGVYASLNFPSTLWGFAGTRLNRMVDKEAGLAALRAYNDWMIDDWCGAYFERFIPCQIPWMNDPVIGAAEVRRNASRGFKAVSFSENPEGLGFPDLYCDHWDPIFRACEETGTVINLHVGSSGVVNRPSSRSPAAVAIALFPLNGVMSVVDWIFAKIPLRFPGLKVVLSEGGVSWVPMIIERLSRAHRQAESSSAWGPSDPDPVEVLHQNFWYTSIEDPSAFRLLDIIGEERVMVESDYPHGDSSWPETQDLVRRDLQHLGPRTIRKICYENAASLYRHPLPPPDLIAASVVGRLGDG